MSKKLLAGILSAVMIVSSSVMAFAAAPGATVDGLGGESSSLAYESSLEAPIINVVIAGAREGVVANPYGLAVANVTADEDGNYPTLVGDKITVTNKSNMKIALGIKGTITLGSGQVKIAADEASMKSNVKDKLLYVEGYVTDNTDDETEIMVKGKAVPHTVFTAKGTPFANEPVLAARSAEDTAASNGVIKVIIDGATSFPESSAWNTDDSFTVTTTFDIKATTADPTFSAD